VNGKDNEETARAEARMRRERNLKRGGGVHINARVTAHKERLGRAVAAKLPHERKMTI